MKEYIEKQELLKLLEDNAIYNADNISCLKTYTQADLESLAYNRGARGFAEKLKEKVSKEWYGTFGRTRAGSLIDKFLKEMGCE